MIIKKEEKKFIQRLKMYPEKFHISGENSVMEGFEYFTTYEYKNKPGAVKSRLKAMITSHSLKNLVRLGKVFSKIMPSILKNINLNFKDMNKFLNLVDNDSIVPTTQEKIMHSFPNTSLWEELKEYAWENHRIIVGFTELTQEYVFAEKAVPFRFALVFAQEMKKESIEKAPKLEAGIEVINVYNSLGIATNDIANWLRNKHGIICMANHPLGGLVDTVPLAAKAGLGAIGRSGLLITKEFGPRCRLSPIFVDQKIFEFTDSDAHSWITEFCKKCGSCVKSCPTSAIYSKSKLSKKYDIEGLKDRYENYDREKCFASFSASMGCGVCISACPFSKNPSIYDKINSKY